MSQYIVSARKYRPDSFESLIGQDNIAQTLKNSILRGQLAHAYLFCGPRGVGKTSTARIFAKTINCANPSEQMEPCGACESCQSFQEGRSYCIHELDAASNNGVDDIKLLMEQVQIPPQVGRYSVYIIDEVHMLTQSAFNAFLKTLEEPPAHAIFILCTTEKHKVLPTILSRCQTYDFNRIGVSDIVRNLRAIAAKEGVKIDDESLHIIARKADGAMRDALTIFDQTVAFCGGDIHRDAVIRNLGVLDSEYGFRLVDAFLSGDYASVLLTFDEILAAGFNALHFIASLSGHLRDLLVSRTGGLEALLETPESLRERYRAQAERCSVKFLYDALGITTACEAGYKMSSNQRLHIEYALMRLCFLQAAPATAAAPAAPAPKPEPKAVKPAPEPGPEVPAPKAEAPARVRKRTSASALSLSELMAADTPAADAPETAAADSGADLPSEELLRERWGAFVSDYASERLSGNPGQSSRLVNALAPAPLSFSKGEDDRLCVSFEVVNEAQRRWIESNLREMERHYNRFFSSSRLHLAVSVRPETPEDSNRVYPPEEKARDLMERNPELRTFVKDLGLDTK
ncbi:MAG: DNA polymerase III subunit gamma/tau [Bacteroidales bacterium]|nr:DNA polymerase III subunit gamma/tau [Bacteroidales bacterium]